MAHTQSTSIPWIKTPLVRSAKLSREAGCNIYLKLENLQPSGSFKSRGIGSFILDHLQNSQSQSQSSHASTNPDSKSKSHFYSSSGGNAGLGCVHAAVTLGCEATVVVPLTTSDYMISKLKDAGATGVIQHSASWVEADTYLREILVKRRDEGEDAVYVPPFDDPGVWSGHATMVDEVLEQLSEVQGHYATGGDGHEEKGGDVKLDVVVCSVGGGGLFSGIMQGLSSPSLQDTTKVLAVETRGADSLSQSLLARKLVTLPAITSIATSLGARTVCQRALDYGLQDNVTSVVVEDKEAVDACKRFLDDERILVEPACGAALAICYEGRLRRVMPELREGSNVVIVVCGGSNISFGILEKYRRDFGV
ncbi:hypothetical protein EG328_011865 [Venturia inaequalis]|uniref:L-serine ammonia-lyase n=1 Tax=Venturia inaequalis TaxID=5025 RepID=A0A8H3Z2R8_VENIN|nr:hypothetical protein EG328_011865 [Venturia inaequalis]